MPDYRKRRILALNREYTAEGVVLVEKDVRPVFRGDNEELWVLTYSDGHQVVGVRSRFIPRYMRIDGWTPSTKGRDEKLSREEGRTG